MNSSMDGKVVLVTGGNSGIGKAAATSLAEMGAEVVLLCRNREKAEKAVSDITSSSGRPVDLIIADMLLQNEVRRAASEFISTRSRLDVLLNNAGSDFVSYQETEDGIERTMALNYFSQFLFTNLLIPTLRKSTPSRIVNVSSAGHYGASLDFGNINGKGDMGTGGLGAYGRSKLALILFTYELARRLQGSGVTANCLHPGAVRTNIWSHAGLFSPLTRLASLFMISPDEGAKTSVYLASSPEVEGVTGKYFEKCKPKRSSEQSYDEAAAARLWELSERMTGLVAQPATP
jgi:NAD(P)-dependent dehydrogenase (short-subunit alcohol dehydrogenase family)